MNINYTADTLIVSLSRERERERERGQRSNTINAYRLDINQHSVYRGVFSWQNVLDKL